MRKALKAVNEEVINEEIQNDNPFSDTRIVLVDYSNIKLTLRQKIVKRRMWRYSVGYDKRYRGPLSLFSLRVIAWICIVLSQLAIVLNIASPLLEMPKLATISQLIEVFSSLSMPLFLLANFAYIIQNKADMGKLILTYLFMMLVAAGCFYLLFLHYGVGLYAKILGLSYKDAYAPFGTLVMLLFSSTFKFNIFVDLFICTLIVYFFLGTPKKIFTGNRIIIFRLFTLIPLTYEIATIVLKILSITSGVSIPFLMTPFMPTKCPVTFIAFVFLVLSEKKRVRKYIKYNGSIEKYDEYFKSKKNSWLFAKSTARSFALAGFIDLVLYGVFFTLAFPPNVVDLPLEQILNTLELGESAGLLLFAPLAFLFSYNKMFKPSKLDIFLPILAIIAIVLIWLETAYQGILNLI